MLVHKHLNQTKPFQRIYPKEPAGRPSKEPAGRPSKEPAGRPSKEPAGRQLWERKHRVTHEFIRGATREGENKTVSTVCQ